MDKQLARKADKILFIKIENDGYDLGAQRRKIEKNDLPKTFEIVKQWKEEQKIDDENEGIAHSVSKEIIAESGDYNLTGEHYRQAVDHSNAKWDMVTLGQVCEIFNGITMRKADYMDKGKIKIIKVKDYDEDSVYFDKDKNGWINNEIATAKYLQRGDTMMINAAHSASHVASKIGYLSIDPPFKSLPSGELTIFRSNEMILPIFLNSIIKSEVIRNELKGIVKGIHIYPKDIKKIKIPLPPLAVQQEIVAKIEAEQALIDGNKKLIEIYEQKIKEKIESVWGIN